MDVLADQAASNYTDARLQRAASRVDAGCEAYLHYTPNETIGGVEFGYVPDAGDVPLVADMSSTILSRPIDVVEVRPHLRRCAEEHGSVRPVRW